MYPPNFMSGIPGRARTCVKKIEGQVGNSPPPAEYGSAKDAPIRLFWFVRYTYHPETGLVG